MTPQNAHKHILIVTDAWDPQVSGVVTSLKHIKRELEAAGDRVSVISPDPEKFDVDENHFGQKMARRMIGQKEIPLAYKPLAPKHAVSQQIEALKPDQIYIATP